MMYYLLLVFSSVLFSFQFLFNKKFEEEYGTSLASAMTFLLYSSVVGGVLLFLTAAFCGGVSFSLFSLCIAVLYSLNSIAYVVVSNRAFETVNLALYSVFAMLGGMLLPALYGVLFRGESLTAGRLICFALMGVSMLFTVDFGGGSGSGMLYAAVFILNGLSGVLSVIHQSSADAVDSISFLFISRGISALLALVFFALKPKSFPKPTCNGVGCSALYAVFCGVGNLLVLISLKHVEASVQYPLVTGGVMLMSLVISLTRKERVGYKDVISTLTAFASAVMIGVL